MALKHERVIHRKEIKMNNHIITEPTGLIKKIALESLKGHWKQMFIALGIYTILTGYVKSILDLIFANYKTAEIMGEELTYNTSFVGDLYQFILTGAFMYGLALFMLTFFRTKRTDNKLLFEGFSMIGKTILLQIVISVFIFLWSLLFIIPGIIAAIRYSMAFYILADHPEYSVTQCINESKARMSGNCGKYFILMLSFIGWAIVASLAQGLILTPFSGSGMAIGYVFGLIPEVFLYVYVKTAETVFYELLTQNLVVMVPDQHVQDQGVDPGNMVNANYEIHEETEAAPENANYEYHEAVEAAPENTNYEYHEAVETAPENNYQTEGLTESAFDMTHESAAADEAIIADEATTPDEAATANEPINEIPSEYDIVGETPNEFISDEPVSEGSDDEISDK